MAICGYKETSMNILFCLSLTLVAAAGVSGIINWWERKPLVEEKSCPLYITKEIF